MALPSRSRTCSAAALLLVLLSTAAAQPHPEGPTEATFDAGAPAVVDVPFHLDEPGEVALKLLPTDDDPVQDGSWSLRATVLRNGTPLAPAQTIDGQNGMDPVAVAAGETHVLRLEVEPGGVAGTTHLALVERDASDGGGNGATLSPSIGIRLTATASEDAGTQGSGAQADDADDETPDQGTGGAGGGGTQDDADPDETTDDGDDAPDGADGAPDDAPRDGPRVTGSSPMHPRVLLYALSALGAVLAAGAILRRA